MTMSAIDRIVVYSQTTGGRVLVGRLWRESGRYVFEYDRRYQKSKGAIAFGPEFDLWRRRVSSEVLFPSIADRIPSKENPAYSDYCRQWGVDPAEKDPFVLLTTIGRRGASTFVFEAERSASYGAEEVRAFRGRLGLNQREFGAIFSISHATLVKLESGRSKNTQILHYLELCDRIPEALEWLMERRGQLLHDEKRVAIMDLIESQKFWRARKSSPAAQLLIPGSDEKKTLFLGEKDGWLASIALVAFRKGLLGRLDELIVHFEIQKKGTPRFKGNLAENWLDRKRETGKEKKAQRDICNATPAAIAELAVARCLECQGYEVVNLEAWDDNSCDVVCRGGERDFYVEIKYLADSPEWYRARTGGGPMWGPTDGRTLNYYFSRIAESVRQLQEKGVKESERMVWLVFDSSTENKYGGRKTFNEFWEGFSEWYQGGGMYPGIPEKEREKSLAKKPREWLVECGILVAATLEDWRIVRPVRVETAHR